MGRPLIYLVAAAIGSPASPMTSRLSRLECHSKPLRAGERATRLSSTCFFAGLELVLADVSSAVIERVADLRARCNLKAPDALHYATSIVPKTVLEARKPMKIGCGKCGHSEETSLGFFVKIIGGAMPIGGFWAWVAYLFAGTGFALPIVIAIITGGTAILVFKDQIVKWIVNRGYKCPKCGTVDWQA